MAADRGLFGPDSVSWRVNREQAMLLGGGCALLLQLAHPLVAAGVGDHSDFLADPLLRLRRTLGSTLALIFGTTEEAGRAVRRIRAAHARVSGTLTEDTGRFAKGTPYDAQTPELLMWVQATLFDTSVRAYRLFFGRLDQDDLERYYSESNEAARLLGIPAEVLPRDIGAFYDYWRRMLASDELAVGETARRLGRAILSPKIRLVPAPAFAPLSLITVGLLPPEVRSHYGFAWSPIRERAFRAEVAMVRRLSPLLPARLRLFPPAREAEQRMARAAS